MNQPVGKSTANWVLGLASVSSVMIAVDTLVVSTALTTIRHDLGASLAELEWIVNAYVLTFAVLLMTAAALGDRFGRRRLFALGLGLFAAASAAAAVAPKVGWLIAARALQGAGAALMQAVALALIGAAFPPERRAKALGIFGAIIAFGLVLGPLVGGAAVEGISWPWIFWINVPIGLLTIALVSRRVPESFGPNTALDGRGVALVTGASFGVVWALVRGNSVGWGSAEVLTALTVGLLLTGAFVAWELRAPHPMLPMQLFRSRPFSAGNASMFFFWGAALTGVFFLAQFLQTADGYGPLATGLRLMPWGAAMFIVAPVAGARIKDFGERPFIVAGLTLNAAGLAWLALIARPHLPYADFVVPLIVNGVGASLALPATQSSVMSHVAPQNIGRASGTFTTLRQLGGAFGVALAVASFAAVGGYASAQAFSDGFTAALAIGAGFALAGAVAGAFAPVGGNVVASQRLEVEGERLQPGTASAAVACVGSEEAAATRASPRRR